MIAIQLHTPMPDYGLIVLVEDALTKHVCTHWCEGFYAVGTLLERITRLGKGEWLVSIHSLDEQRMLCFELRAKTLRIGDLIPNC